MPQYDSDIMLRLISEPRKSVRRLQFLAGLELFFSGTLSREAPIVGAGSVVTKDVAPNTIVAGNTARVIITMS